MGITQRGGGARVYISCRRSKGSCANLLLWIKPKYGQKGRGPQPPPPKKKKKKYMGVILIWTLAIFQLHSVRFLFHSLNFYKEVSENFVQV